jgi:lysine-specific demethylase/histidyl-hydroxylase NO66
VTAARRASALERCIGDPGRFLSGTWNRTPCFHRSDSGFEDLMSATDVDRMLTTMSLRVPAFRLVKDGTTIPSARYTRRGRTGGSPVAGIADPRRILDLFRDGATIVLQGMHRYWAPLRAFCRDLEIELGHPAQVNAYITPPGSRGLAVHSDDHDVFVLQSFGGKHWEVWERGAPKPPPGPALITRRLEPGDCLYVPRGTPHAARTQQGPSGHLTIGILTTTWSSLLREIAREAAARPEFDEPLPAGYHRDPARFARNVDIRLARLRDALACIDPSAVADRAIERFLTARPAMLSRGFLDALAEAGIDERTEVRRRPGSVCELRSDGDRLDVLLGDRMLRMPAWVEPAMRTISGEDVLTPADLAPFLGAESAVVLVRRLVREGLLEIAVAAVGGSRPA